MQIQNASTYIITHFLPPENRNISSILFFASSSPNFSRFAKDFWHQTCSIFPTAPRLRFLTKWILLRILAICLRKKLSRNTVWQRGSKSKRETTICSLPKYISSCNLLFPQLGKIHFPRKYILTNKMQPPFEVLLLGFHAFKIYPYR